MTIDKNEKIPLHDWIYKVSPIWELKDAGYWKQMFIRANQECLTHVEQVVAGTKQVLEPQSWNYASTKTITVPIWKTVRTTPAQQLKHIRWHHRRPPGKVNSYGDQIDRCLLAKIHELSKDDDCVDNIRFAETTNRADMRRFRKAMERGCCGSHSSNVTIDTLLGFGTPRVFVVGFNYGH